MFVGDGAAWEIESIADCSDNLTGLFISSQISVTNITKSELFNKIVPKKASAYFNGTRRQNVNSENSQFFLLTSGILKK